MKKHLARFFKGFGIVAFMALLAITLLLTMSAIGAVVIVVGHFINVGLVIGITVACAVCYGVGYVSEKDSI